MTLAQRASLLTSFLVLALLLVSLVGYQSAGAQPWADDDAPGADGAEVFARTCAACHGAEGDGRLGPALDGNLNLSRSDYVTAIVLRGRDGMPPFNGRLSGAEIEAVSRYVRTAWGNYFADDDEDRDGGDEVDEVEGEYRALLAAQWWQGAEDAAELFERVCARCHGEEGGGGFGPPLVQNENLGDPQYVAGKILHGQGGMPAFEGLLSLRQITALATHVRNSFGNSFGEVELATVSSLQSEPPGARRGALRASVFPGGARLTILGPDRFVHFESQAGTSQGSVRLAGLLPGSYSVVASRDGYRTATATVEVRPLQESRVTLNLQSFPAEPPIETGERDTFDEEPAAQVGQLTRALDSPAAPLINAEEYRSSCALCHGPDGEGGVGPPLAGNANLQNSQFVLDRILYGAGPMPAFADRLSNEQVAAIATHERVAWGNAFGPVAASEVGQHRQEAGPGLVFPSGLVPAADTYESLCSVCHGGLGFGGVGPPFQGNERLRDTSYTLSRIVMGGDGMPAFADVLSSAQMAQLATFIRTEWGNEFGPVALYQAQNYHGGPSSRTP